MNDENKGIRKRYLRYLKLERANSGNTIEAYAADVDRLFTFFESEGIAVLDAKLPDFEAFAASLFDEALSAKSQARVLSGVRSLYRYLLLDGYIEQDPTELLSSPQIGRHLPEVLTTEEIDCLQDSIDLNKWEGQRNRAIIEVLFSCGLRVSELINMKLSQIYMEERFIRVLGKGNKERLVPISQKALDEIVLWLKDREEVKIKAGEEDFLFISKRGGRLTRVMILIMIKRQAVAAGITKTISPHTLRHSFATSLLQGGANLRVIQSMLGHEDITTTEIYTHIDTTTLRKEILEHHPRNRL